MNIQIYTENNVTYVVNYSKGIVIAIFTRDTHFEVCEYCRYYKSSNKEEKFSIPYYTLENVIGYYKRMLE